MYYIIYITSRIFLSAIKQSINIFNIGNTTTIENHGIRVNFIFVIKVQKSEFTILIEQIVMFTIQRCINFTKFLNTLIGVISCTKHA